MSLRTRVCTHVLSDFRSLRLAGANTKGKINKVFDPNDLLPRDRKQWVRYIHVAPCSIICHDTLHGLCIDMRTGMHAVMRAHLCTVTAQAGDSYDGIFVTIVTMTYWLR